jgi:hypothetical protein
MAETALVGSDIDTGRLLVDQLRRAQVPLRAAAWVYESANEEWRLYLVTPVSRGDLREAYLKVAVAMLADDESKERFKDISYKIVDVKEPLGKALIAWAKDAAGSFRRVSGSLPRGPFIDAVVYGAAA